MKFCSLMLSAICCLIICGCKKTEKNIVDEKYYVKFHLVHYKPYSPQQNPVGYILYVTPDGDKLYVKKNPEMVITKLNDAYAYRNEFGDASIRIFINGEDSRKFAEFTEKHAGCQTAIIINGEICCAPYIREKITAGNLEILVPSIEKAEEIADKLYKKEKLLPWL